jgi:hypothetical protein
MSDSNITKVISILRDNSFEQEANHLEGLLEQLSSNDEELCKNASSEVQGLCQVRSYGNLNIKTMNGWKWNSMLDKVANHVRK